MVEYRNRPEQDHFTVSSFADLVHQGKQRYVDLRESPLQGVELPDAISHVLFETVISHLPSYIPSRLIEKIHEDHPTPLIHIGMIIDKRVLNPHGVVSEVSIPDEFNDYFDTITRGLWLLDEYSNQRLALDVLQQLGKTNLLWLQGLKRSIALAARFDIFDQFSRTGNFLQTMFGNDFQALNQELVVAMLSGTADRLHTFLEGKDSVSSIYDLALLLGLTNEVYGAKAEKKKQQLTHTQNVLTRSEYSFFTIGTYCSKFPGVIDLPVLQNALLWPPLMAGATGSTLFAVYEFLLQQQVAPAGVFAMLGSGLGYAASHQAASIPHAIVHELMHYLAHGKNHRGLFMSIRYPNVTFQDS